MTIQQLIIKRGCRYYPHHTHNNINNNDVCRRLLSRLRISSAASKIRTFSTTDSLQDDNNKNNKKKDNNVGDNNSSNSNSNSNSNNHNNNIGSNRGKTSTSKGIVLFGGNNHQRSQQLQPTNIRTFTNTVVNKNNKSDGDDKKQPTKQQQQQSSSAQPSSSSPQQQKSFKKKKEGDKLAKDEIYKLMGQPLQQSAGPLWGTDVVDDDDDFGGSGSHHLDGDVDDVENPRSSSSFFIPEVGFAHEVQRRKRILILCTGGTLTMAPDPNQGGGLAPVEGAISDGMSKMEELDKPGMPEYVLHEYSPFRDSSDLGPADWATLARDIKANYLHFDGFVIITGTDTMAYCATALSFMLENLGKPVVFTGSQIPLTEPYNDARRNLIMAMIFASRDTINEVTIFFHDRLLRANRSTKVNTHRLLAFDSPNLDPLASIGITIDENEHLVLPPPRGALRVHTRMDTRLLTIRLVPGFDDGMIRHMIDANLEKQRLRALVLQLYGTGNIPSVKKSFIQLLADARDKGILVIASTQCYTGSVMMGHYAVGQALQEAGVVSASDMTLEAIACKMAYLAGRQDLELHEQGELMGVSLRGEITPPEALSPPPLSSAYQRAKRKGKYYY